MRDINIVRKNLAYLDLFAYRVVANNTDFSYGSKIAAEALIFYQYSTNTSKQLGNAVFRDVYGATEMLQRYYTQPHLHSISHLRDLYDNKISPTLQQACATIVGLDKTVFEPDFKNNISTLLYIEIACLLSILLLACLLLLILGKTILSGTEEFVCMLKIIPVWILERNPEAYEEICS